MIQLLEILSGKEVRRYTKNTRSAIQRLDNIHVALDFLENEMNLRVLGCNPQGASRLLVVARTARVVLMWRARSQRLSMATRSRCWA